MAHALKDLPKISDAFRQGRLSYSKVRAMTRVGTPENEDYLLMIAKHGTAAHVDRLVGLYYQVKRSDGGCRFPGCTCTRFVDAHHIRHWADGGDTSMDNLTLLCRHHHRLVHEGGFSVAMNVGGPVRFTKPNGQVMPNNGATNSRGNVIALRTAHAAAGIHITPKTTITKWCGEQMDDQLAVEGLFYRE